MTQVVFSRALVGLGLTDLTIGTDPNDPFWLDEGGIILPELEHRVTFAETSQHVAGELHTQAVEALGTLGFTFYLRAGDAATLTTQRADLRAVFKQFTYTAALTLYGTDTFTCLPGRLSWVQPDSGMVGALLAKAVVTIPVQPLEA